jgi:RNA polymerase sigma factor (sigma-70 family)
VIAPKTEPTAEFGDEEADILWRSQFAGLKRLAFMLLGQEAAAEDAVSRAFARTLTSRRQIDQPAAYLRAAVINSCRDDLRRLARERARDTMATPSAEAWMDLGHIELRDALMSLPVRQRTAVVLRHVVDLDDIEAAALMGCRPGTVRSLVRHGLARLRKELTE